MPEESKAAAVSKERCSDPREDPQKKTTKCGAGGKIGNCLETLLVRKARIQEGDTSPRRSCLRSLLVHWVGAIWMKLSLSETEVEKASPFQTEELDCETWELPVRCKNYCKASGSEFVNPRSASMCFSPCGTWLDGDLLWTEPQWWSAHRYSVHHEDLITL